MTQVFYTNKLYCKFVVIEVEIEEEGDTLVSLPFYCIENQNIAQSIVVNYIRYLSMKAAARMYIPTETFLWCPLSALTNT